MFTTLINLKMSTLNKGSCFSLAFSKTCQHACNDINVCAGFQNVNLTATQSTLQKKSYKLKSLMKDATNGRRHALILGSFIEN